MRCFKNLKTTWKLLGGFGIVCVIMAFVGYTGVSKMSEINGLLGSMYEKDLMGVSHAKDANFHLMSAARHIRNIILADDAAERKNYQKALDDAIAHGTTALESTAGTLVTDDGRALLASASDGVLTYYREIGKAAKLCAEGDVAEGTRMLKAARDAGQAATTKMDQLVGMKEALAKQSLEESTRVYAHSRLLVIGLIVGGVLVSLAIGVVIARLIAGALRKSVRVLESVAQGDFTARLEIDSEDEVGQMAHALNSAVDAIRAALQETRSVADNLALAAQQLSSASEEISSGAQEQASSLEQTASSLEEITSTVRQNADNAEQANQLALGAREVAEKGGQVVGHAVRGMAEINASSKKIADIISAIDEIAFQTNLLALNAAVEAARAGEQGRGFAVVAGEVRNLAQRSAAAAKEIKGLIQDSVRKVETGSDLVNQSGKSLEDIVSSVKRVTDIVSEIAAASREQTTGIEQVNKAVSQMDQVTQANAGQTEELSSTAQGLAGQAEQLQSLVSRFKLEESSRRTVAAAATCAAPSQTAASVKKATAKKCTRATPTKGAAYAVRPMPAATEQLLDGLEMVGAGADGHAGFEEF
jgi:methyl-accepting chemotaxis protein